jgi:3-oxo-5-alpha-steroid 4-dehydrogenase 1
VSELDFHRGLLLALFGVAALTLVGSQLVTAPYGRYPRPRWSGPELPSRLGWMLMELPQPVGLALCFATAARPAGVVAYAWLGLWMFHYTYRTLIYPFVPRASSMSAAVVGLGMVLNVAFSYVNGRWLFALGPERPAAFLYDLRFVAGTLAFFAGFALCAWSDLHLRSLRGSGPRRYVVPTRGPFRLVASPNYAGELVMWLGWSLATWSLAGLVIAAVSASNLVPRARRNLRWYRDTFPDYPPKRKALVPFLF